MSHVAEIFLFPSGFDFQDETVIVFPAFIEVEDVLTHNALYKPPVHCSFGILCYCTSELLMLSRMY